MSAQGGPKPEFLARDAKAGVMNAAWERCWPAPAKLNLMLHLVGRRADGYHLLQSVFRLIDLADTLAFAPRNDRAIRSAAPLAGVPEDADLSVRAARLLQAETGCDRGATIAIDKRIPVGGGLGGGSSDAATTLIALNELWGTGLARPDLARIGLALGAHVPFFVFGRNALGDVPPARSRTPARFARSGAAQKAQSRAVRAPQEILRSIADDTGGTASANTNDLARGMQAAAKDARGYYLLAYAPPAGRKEGRYYPIEVKVARPGLHLRYRRGYEWLSEARRAERAMAGALSFPGLYAEDGLALDPWVEAGKLHVAVILPTRNLSFRLEGGLHRNEIAIQGLLRDDQGRPVGERFPFTKTIDMKLPEDRLADLDSRDNVEIANEVPS